jgi:hypothetical protein
VLFRQTDRRFTNHAEILWLIGAIRIIIHDLDWLNADPNLRSIDINWGVRDYKTVVDLRRVWRYQKGNQNPYVEEEQTTQWPEEKVQNDNQRSTKHTHKTKDRVTRTPLKTGDALRCSGRVSSSSSSSDTSRVNLVSYCTFIF